MSERSSHRLWPLAVACSLAVGVSGCGDGDGPDPTLPTEASTVGPPVATVPDIDCPPDALDCETAGGEIVYVERIDPDGDGDAHFVLLSREGITAPEISVIDVRADLRPEPLPGPGDLLSAAGPVFEGSYGQRQIQAEAIEVERVP